MVYPHQRTHSSEIIGSLLEKADVQGYLTPEDILDVYPGGTEDDEQVHHLFLSLQRQGIEIIDEEGGGYTSETEEGNAGGRS